MDYSSTFARVLACYSPEVDRSIQAPSFEQPRTVCVREETSCLETSEDALRSLMCDFFFLTNAVIEHDAQIPTLLFWLTENEPMVVYSRLPRPFSAPVAC
jgi:hypothetical protein